MSALTGTAQPTVTPDLPVMRLDEVGIYSVGYAYRGAQPKFFPLGWSGFFDDETGVACQSFGSQNGKAAFLLHSPWRGGVGVAFQQFTFALPNQATRVVVRGFTALRTENVANSDGVTFRLTVNGQRLFSYHQTNDLWRAFSYDLTAWRGSNVTLRFEVDPGPNNSPSFDYSFWADRALILEGYSPPQVARLSPPPLVLSNVWATGAAEVAPHSAFPGTSSYSLSNDVATFRYSGPDGELTYEWRRPQSALDSLFGSIILRARMEGDKSVEVPLATAAELTWTQAATPLGSTWTQEAGGLALQRTFILGTNSVPVRVAGQLVGKTLALVVSCDAPEISALEAGTWGPVLRRRQVPVPFYSGSAYYLPNENLFVGALLDFTASAASSHSGSKAHYTALTDRTRVPLRERVLFTAAWHLAEVLPNPPNPPSPWLNYLKDKIVLDIWGGTFANISNNFSALADYGITNCIAIIHNWQRSGYDNALPMHYPANAAYGGDQGMRNLIAAGKQHGIRSALHENYVDYYPNYDFYDTNHIALDSSGALQLAWYNPGTKIQSFAIKPNAILPLAAAQSPEIHRRYSTEANYLDVHSAVPPWFHVDQRAGEAGAGRFSLVRGVHRQLWEYERETHRGPVLGEGNNHWYWSGLLDGVEAQFGSGWPGNGGFTVPLAVDFDLIKIHPLQFNHGMGYYSRWWPTESYHTNWAGPAPMVVLDRYRMQEVAFGHAGFLDGSVYSHIPYAWLEHHLLSPLMARYARARPVEVAYLAGDGSWLDTSAAVRRNDAAPFEVVKLRYENELTITANSRSNAIALESHTLPAFGWVAEGAGISAGTTLRDGVVADFSDTTDSLFLNARPASDWNLSSYRRVRPTVASFSQTGPRAFRVLYNWSAQDRVERDYRCFVHFDAGGSIRAQQDHVLTTPTSRWDSGQTISDGPWNVTLPANLPDGDYTWLIGLFDPADGGRVPLQGLDDGTARIRLGVLRLADFGTTVTFTPETNSTPFDPGAWYSQHLNTANRVIDFGDARTDGSVWLRLVGNEWVMKTWPRDRAFTIEFNSARFSPPNKILSPGGVTTEVVPIKNGNYWRLPSNAAHEYRWTNQPPRLSISRTNDTVVISWPAAGTGYALETTTRLDAPSDWGTAAPSPVTANGLTSVTMPLSEPMRFHRLRADL